MKTSTHTTTTLPVTGHVRHRALLIKPEEYKQQPWLEGLLATGLLAFKQNPSEIKGYQMNVVNIKLDARYAGAIEKSLPNGITMKDFATHILELGIEDWNRKMKEANA